MIATVDSLLKRLSKGGGVVFFWWFNIHQSKVTVLPADQLFSYKKPQSNESLHALCVAIVNFVDMTVAIFSNQHIRLFQNTFEETYICFLITCVSEDKSPFPKVTILLLFSLWRFRQFAWFYRIDVTLKQILWINQTVHVTPPSLWSSFDWSPH